ncbi:zinc transporter ZIP1-like [Lytechinus pictus]|uniref:zinc transporter ZIP1-like n=1 Tax=Lytechinus pictus TaxID=7653 RepID=UPI0030BA2621
MEVLGLKITLMFVLTLTCFFFALIPLRIAKLVTNANGNPNRPNIQRQAKRVMSFLGCFGGGVFLCTCLLDLLPHVRDKLSSYFDRQEIHTSYPVAEFVVACGFFLVLIIEQTALEYKEKSDSSKPEKEFHAPDAGELETNTPLLPEEEVRYEGTSNQRCDYGSFQQECNSSLNVHGNAKLQRSLSNRSTRDINADEADNHDLHSHSALRSLLLLLALSLHSVFEGLAMGLQTDNQELLAIFTAVIIHKNILAFSLGMNLVQSHLSRCSVVLSCLCFAMMAPIGITLGIILIESISDFTQTIADGILQGIATGTFLYVTFFEVLPHEMNSSKDRLLKVLFLVLGFSTMAGLLFLDPS